MSQIADGWDIVSRRTNQPIRHLIGMMLQMVLMAESGFYSTVTWTVRQTASGTVRKVTARSEREAGEKIALGTFDKE